MRQERGLDRSKIELIINGYCLHCRINIGPNICVKSVFLASCSYYFSSLYLSFKQQLYAPCSHVKKTYAVYNVEYEMMVAPFASLNTHLY